jgi:hypothetical protein
MVTIVLRNLTNQLRVMTNPRGVAGKEGIAVPGRMHGDGCSEPVLYGKLKSNEQDIKTNLKYKRVELVARFGSEERVVTFDEAEALLIPAPEPKLPAILPTLMASQKADPPGPPGVKLGA